MPIYEYICTKGHKFDRLLPMAESASPQMCSCGAGAEKQLSRPVVRGDLPGYECPVSGKWIEGRKAHIENLVQTGCRVFESGEREQALKRKAREEARFEDKLEQTVDRALTEMGPDKVAQVCNEVAAGATTEIIRNTL